MRFAHAGTANVAYDRQHERLVQFINGETWEVVVSDAEMPASRLAPRGTAPVPTESQIVLHDTVNDRLLVVDRDDAMVLHALDLTRRGAETWTTFTALGDRPPVEGRPTFAVWQDATRIWLYGGDPSATSEATRLASLDISVVGSERWTLHPLGTDNPHVLLCSVVAHPTSPGHALLFGGAGAGGFNTGVYDLDVGTGAVTFTRVADLPSLHVSSRAAALGSIVVVAGGMDVIFGTPSETLPVLTFDPMTNEWSTITRMPSTDSSALLVTEPDGMLTYVDIEPTYPTRRVELSHINVESRSVTAYGVESGSPATDGAFLFGSQLRAVEPEGPVWALREFDPVAHLWTRRLIAPDIVLGTTPPVRTAFLVHSTSHDLTRGMVVFGGLRSSGSLIDTDLWELQADAHWIHRRVTTGPMPLARSSASSTTIACPDEVVTLVVGGVRAGGGLLDDAWMQRCTAGRDCVWAEAATTGPRPPPGANASLVPTTDGNALLLQVGAASIHRLATCGDTQWSTMINAGAPATALRAMTYARNNSDGDDVIIALSGIASLDGAYWLTVTDPTTAQWEAITIDTSDSAGPRVARVMVWDETLDRLLVLEEQTWELLIR